MALSFEDSLKTANTEETSMTTDDTLTVSNDVAVMSLSDDDTVYVTSNASVAAYALSDDEWTLDDKNYPYFAVYNDSNISSVDADKNITVDPNQINITQEENSQYIPFEMPRYYDGFDLSKTAISIHYTTSDEYHGAATPINVKYSNDKIRFGWLVDSYATHVNGTIKFEIQASGSTTDNNGKSYGYTWKSRPNSKLNVLQSICNENEIELDDSWVQEIVTTVAGKVAQQIADAAIDTQVKEANQAAANAQTYANDAQMAANNAALAAESVVNEKLADYVTKEYVDGLDISGQLVDYVKTTDLEDSYYNKDEIDLSYATKEYVDSKDISDKLVDYVKTTDLEASYYNKDAVDLNIATSLNGYATETYVNAAIADADISEKLEDYYTKEETYNHAEIDEKLENVSVDLTGYATESYVDNKSDLLSASINTNAADISSLSSTVADLQTTVNSIDTSPRLTYDASYNTEGDYSFVLYEIENEGSTDSEVRTEKAKFVIQGGGGGSSTSSVLKIEYVTTSPVVATTNDKVVIKYNFSGTDSSGDIISDGAATWKVAGKVVATNTAVAGENSFDVTEYLSVGTQKVNLTITDDAGSLVTKNWTVQKIDVRLESTFNDKLTYPIGNVSFDYTPYGAVEKTVHFVLDGVEIGTVTTSTSGIPMAYEIPAQTHGAHLFEVYMTATINGNTIESNHIVKDIIWYDSESTAPVIGCTYQEFTAKQYDSTGIVYTVYDPSTENPVVTLAVDGEIISTLTLDNNTQTWLFKSTEQGTYTLTITCGETVKTLIANIEKLDINIEPVTAGLVFDFNPTGMSNNDADRLWSSGDIAMSVSDNFDWVNGGYQIDENGDQYFCIKSGTSAVINYNLFGDDAKRNGKEFKLIFKTANVENASANFLSCVDGSDIAKIGIEMNVHEAYIHANAGSLYLPYSEEDIIEFEFNINKSTDAIPMVMGYEDGVATRPMIYSDSHNFTQNSPKYITIGSEYCDVFVYRFKVYNAQLTDRGILSNFIADARNAEEMIARYNRNQIYDENNALTPETLAEKCPQLRIIMIDAPHFTNNKSDKVTETTIRCIYKNGDSVLDNWTAYNCMHSGQGTTSNEYGAAGRNLDLIMNKSGVDGVDPYIVLGDDITQTDKVSLTRDSVEVNYFNVKVNIASSENANNALLQKRYNTYNPYTRPAKQNNPNVKDTMEFFNCVVFIKENDTDLTTHREFQDNDWHFYGIGNIGDSKKTDKTRLNDKDDPLECIVEIMDNTFPNSTFPSDEEGLANLELDPFDESMTYGWRYEPTDIQGCIDAWKEFYKFVVQSTDEEFKANLGNYFVVDSALYFYLYTTVFTMIDNRAKNTFWHYGKTGEVDSEGNPIRKWDLCFNYDNDTGLGINNSGELTMTYGYEDTDYKTKGDASTGYAFNAATSTFFCRIRDLFVDELRDMYVSRESAGAWNAEGIINQFDEWQSEFPEELWRLDIERKYLRPYRDGNTRFLNQMANGRKKYQRRQFMRNQEKYMASKFFGNVAVSDQIMFRCNTPTDSNLVVKPDYTLHLTPYADMYIDVLFGSTYRTQVRAEAGKQYDIECPFTTMDDTAVLVYCSSLIQSMGDISACYIHDNDFSKASKLKELIVGNATEGYQNSFLTNLGIGNNTLLEKLDIQNTPNLAQSLNLTNCGNLRELYAHGSGLTGVVFADGGMIEITELPAIGALTMKNLAYLTNFDVTSFDNLNTLVVENCGTIDLQSIFEQATNLNRVRIVGVDWLLSDTSLLDSIYNMAGIDKNGYNVSRAVLTGKVFVPIIGERKLYQYKEAWPDLEVTFNSMINQYAVTFVNADGTVLDVQYVDEGGEAVDPVTREDNPIPIPIKKSTVSTEFTYNGWDSSFVNIYSARTITATYTETIRSYTVKYVSMGYTMQETTAPYGSYVEYQNETPTYTLEEESAHKYYLFNRWDKSGLVDGDKTITAVFDSFKYTEDAFTGREFSDLSPVEIYALTQLGLDNVSSITVEDGDPYSFNLGCDINFDDVESEVIISDRVIFNGIDNHKDTGIKLFDEDKDFVIAIDYKFLSGNVDDEYGNMLLHCYNESVLSGLKLYYMGDSARFKCDSTEVATVNRITSSSSETNREILVIRHKKGSENITIYKSDTDSIDGVSTVEFAMPASTAADCTLVLGCGKFGSDYSNNSFANVDWCKIWYGDIGEESCKKIACWPHEKVNMEVCGLKKYFLSDGSGNRCNITMIASNLMNRTMRYNKVSTTANAWADSDLCNFLNTRIYDAMPIQMKAIIKNVIVNSSVGNKSTDIKSANCYVYIPAIRELSTSSTFKATPYSNEAGYTISYMVGDENRKRAPIDGNYAAYWTRSPNVQNASYVWQITAEGATNGYVNSSGLAGVLIQISL